jgi:CHC2-type zinc finger protein/Toprim domain-containing protein
MSSTLRYDRHEIAEAKSGASLQRIVGETVRLIRDGRRWVGLCPVHSERTPSLTIFDDGHFHCYGCGIHGDAVTWLTKVRGFSFCDAMRHISATPTGGRPQVAPQPSPAPTAPSPTLAAAQRVWREALPARNTIVERYLKNRGLPLPDGVAIRFHPECQRGGRDSRGCVSLWPAMIALLVNPITGKGVGVHRTFLAPDGTKAPTITRGNIVLPSKSILGGWGSVRIPPPNETRGTLAISEGLENALAAQVLLQWEWGPVWATGCAANIAAFPVLPWVTSLTVFADNDPVGIKAARACEARWREVRRHVELQFPPHGHDWNSALREREIR